MKIAKALTLSVIGLMAWSPSAFATTQVSPSATLLDGGTISLSKGQIVNGNTVYPLNGTEVIQTIFPECVHLGQIGETVESVAAMKAACPDFAAGFVPKANVGLIETPTSGSKYFNDATPFGGEVRLIVRDSTTQTIKVGPVLMEYGDYSGGSRPERLYGPGSIWLYDPHTPAGPQLLRISTTTGVVLQRTTTPEIYEPILALNDLGVWMGFGRESGWDAPKPTTGVYLAAVGAKKMVLLAKTTNLVEGMTSTTTSMTAIVLTNSPSSLKPRVQDWVFKQYG